MRILIDECIDESLRLLFPGHDCQTVRHANLAGLKDGRLLDAAEAAGFEVLITADQHIPEQQNLSGRKISIMIFCAPTKQAARLGDNHTRRDTRGRRYESLVSSTGGNLRAD